MPRRHLAILTQPFLDLILNGRKTIETRFTKVACAPFAQVKTGDVILLKETSGLVLGEFTAGKVTYYNNMTPDKIQELQSFSKEIAADAIADFWETRQNARFVTFIEVKNPKRYDAPFPFPKKDRRGWVILPEHPPAPEHDLFDLVLK